MTAADAHRWARIRFPARRAGLLTDSEEQRIAEHLASCEPCRAAWQAVSGVAEDGDARVPTPTDTHIPAGLLATWPRSSAHLMGLERALVREHLERCMSCRQDLELLGYAPTLETVPALEWSGATADTPVTNVRAVARREPEPAHVIHVFKPPPRRRDWTQWAFGGWAAIASAAALLLVVNPGLIGRGGEELPTGGPEPLPPVTSPETTAPPTPAPGPATLVLTGRPLRLRSGLRGEATRLPERLIMPDTWFVPLVVEPLDLPDTSTVEVTIQREGEPTIIRTTVVNRDLDSGGLMFTAGGQPIRPGTYIVRLKGGPGPDAILPEPEVAEYRFALRVAPGISSP
jgi:hypothetical protein